VAETLKDVMPREMAGDMDTAAYKLRDVTVVAKHSLSDDDWKPWPGSHKNVVFWVILTNGKAVGWNENLSRGWSFPVIRVGASR
jgi:hypothetical protein